MPSHALPVHDLHPARSAFGTLWRCVAMLLAACVAVLAGAWVDSKIVIDSDELASLGSTVVALAIGITAIHWLRARDGYLVAVAIGADFAGVGGAYTLSDGLLDGGRLHPEVLEANVSNVMAAAGVVVLVLALVLTGVSGHRHPRKPGPNTRDSSRSADTTA